MAGCMVCSGLLGLSGVDGSASTNNQAAWTGLAPNGGNHRSIAQNAGAGTGAADLNNQTIRNFSGGGSSGGQIICMGYFYNAPPTYSFGSTNVINEGTYPTNPTFVYTVNTTKVPNGAVLTWSLVGGSASLGTDFISPTSGSFTVNGNQGTFPVTVVADRLTEGTETFTLNVYRAGPVLVLSRTDSITDTSLTWSASAGAYTNPVGEASNGTFAVNTANIPDGTTLYVNYVYLSNTSAANFSSQPTSFVVNGNAGSLTYTTTGNNLPNQFLGTFGGVQAYQVNNGTFRIDVYRDGFPGAGGTLLFNGPTITMQDTSVGPTNTITFSGPANTQCQVSICTSYNASFVGGGFSKSGGPYRVGLPNNIVICIPAGADYRGQGAIPALTIAGGQQILDSITIKVKGIIRGMGGKGANGGACGFGYAGGPAISIVGHSGGTITIACSSGGYIVGGGGGGGGSGAYTGLGGGGAGGGDGGFLCNPGYLNSKGSTTLNTNGANGTISGPSNRYRWGGGGGSYLPTGGAVAYGMGEVGGSGGGAQGYGGGQGGGGGGQWCFTGPAANTIRGGRGGTGSGTGGDGSKLITNNLTGAVGGGGGGWGAAGGLGGSVATSSASLTATRAGGAGGKAINLNGATYSGPGGATIYGAVS